MTQPFNTNEIINTVNFIKGESLSPREILEVVGDPNLNESDISKESPEPKVFEHGKMIVKWDDGTEAFEFNNAKTVLIKIILINSPFFILYSTYSADVKSLGSSPYVGNTFPKLDNHPYINNFFLTKTNAEFGEWEFKSYNIKCDFKYRRISKRSKNFSDDFFDGIVSCKTSIKPTTVSQC